MPDKSYPDTDAYGALSNKKEVTVLSWNIWWKFEDYLNRQSLIFNELTKGPKWVTIKIIGIVGFIHSILTPEFTGGTSTWNIFDYYVGHSMLLIIPAWLMMYYDQRLRHNAWWTSFIYLQLLVVLVSQANSIIGNGANYMYLAKAPIADNPLVLQDPYHIIGFEIFAIIHFYVLDIIARRIFDK